MKLPAFLLTGSLAGNVVLVATLAFRPALAPPEYRDFFQRLSGSPAPAVARAAPPREAPAKSPDDHRSLWAKLATNDLPTLVARLRTAGFSPAMIRSIVSAQIEAQFRDRMNALVGTVADTPFWKPEPTNSLNNPKFFEEYNQIFRERAKLLREVLGEESLAGSAATATEAQRRMFGDLPKAKIALVQRIADDYAEMMSQVRAASQGITLPDDREKLALLEREKRADLAAILSPQELENYELRTSNLTNRLRQTLTLMDASEEEFRTIFRVQQPYTETLYPTARSGTDFRQRQEVVQKVADEIKAALGESRYVEYARANNFEYQQLVRLGQRENISTEALNRTYALRDSLIQESDRIYNDRQMSVEQKRAALTQLGQTTKAQVLTNLGLTAGNAYIQTSQWLNAPERGWIIRPSPDGQGNSYSTLPGPAPSANSGQPPRG